MKIGYVCTNYNGAAFTMEAVRTLVGGKHEGVHIAVVDNSSRADDQATLRKIEKEFPEVEVLFSPTNLGYFSGLNLGIRHLRTKLPELEVMVVGNNDLTFPAEFVAQLNAVAGLLEKHPVLSPDVVTLDGVHQNPHVIATISRKRELAYDIFYSNYHVARVILKIAHLTKRFTGREDQASWETPRSIYQGHGSCYILGPVFFRNFRELWAPTFMMAEEYFLGKQLSDAGMSVFYEPSIRVIHHYHATVGKIPGRKMWELARDAHREYRKYVKGF